MKTSPLFSLMLMGLSFAQDAELSLSGKSYVDMSTGFGGHDRTFENWTDVHGEYGNFNASLGTVAFMPARSFSRDSSSPGIAFSQLEWQSGEGAKLQIGHFYTQLGNGITLRSYRDYVVRWDNSLLGLNFENRGEYWSFKALSATARDLDSRRYAPLQAFEFSLSPWNIMNLGLTGVATRDLQKQEQRWGSAFAKWKHYGDVFGIGLNSEYALKEENSQAHAFYTSADVLLGPLSWVSEFKDYKGFDLSNGAPLNNAPMAAKEHTYSLMARKQLQADAKNIRGYTSELAWKLPIESSEWVLRASTTRALTDTSKSGAKDPDFELFNEYFGVIELNKDALGLSMGGGIQNDASEDHINAVMSLNMPINDNYFVKTLFEHQHATVKLTDKQFYSQIYRLTLSMYRKLSLGVVGEMQMEDHLGQASATWWPGLQVDLHVNDQSSLSLFSGLRKAGKDCSGGVCVQKPEFQGLELIGNFSF